MAIVYRAKVLNGVVDTVALFEEGNIPPAFSGWVACDEEVMRGWTYSNGSFVAPPPEPGPTPTELEAEVQAITDRLLVTDERMVALAFATVDLAMADIPAGATKAQVRQQFKDRVMFYLRERRGI